MTLLSPRRAVRAALLGTVLCALAPAVASASTWTVDDDKAQCPNAGFTSVQAAVDQAAPWDTVIICQGLYLERSTPASSAASFAQPGSQNGLTITKPLTIKGAGAAKVTIRPAVPYGTSLAGSAPYLRDGGGNVITISRQSLGASDDNENFVDISGITVDSPDAYAEAGVAFFNTSGRIAKSTIGPLRRSSDATELAARPHGWGVVQTNSLQGSGTGSVRRQVTIVDSLVTGYQSGGVLFDDSVGGIDGAATNTTRSGIIEYGNVTGSRIVGSGSNALIPQTGVRFHAGARGGVTGSEVSGNYYSPTPANAAVDRRAAVGILLTDAETGDDPSNPGTPAFTATGNRITGNGYGMFNADITNAAVRLGAPAQATGNWWASATSCPIVGSGSTSASSCQGISGNDTASAASIVTGTILAAAPTTLVVPVVPTDGAPSVGFTEPTGTPEVQIGEEVDPVVIATDDYGVQRVTVTADGAPVGSTTLEPYEFHWTPTAADAGKTITLRALATDSSGQTSLATTDVKVLAPPVVDPPPPPPPAPLVVPVNTARPSLSGALTVGRRLTCLPGSWTAGPTSYTYSWTRSGVTIPGVVGGTYVPVAADTASEIACNVVAHNGDGASEPAPAPGETISYVGFTTGLTDKRQIGSAIVKLSLSAKAKAGKVTVGSAQCIKATAATCTVTLGGTLKIGKASFKVAAQTVSVPAGQTVSLALTLPAKGVKALKTSGVLALKTKVVDDTGSSASRTTSLTIKKG